MIAQVHSSTLRRFTRVARVALALALAAALLPAPAAAQKVGREYFEDETFGYRVKYPKDWNAVPVMPQLKGGGVAALFKGESISVNAENSAAIWQPDLYVYVLEKELATTGEEATGLRGRVNNAPAQVTIVDRIGSMALVDFDGDNPIVDETKKIKKLTARHRVWKTGFQSNMGKIPMTVDVWSFPLPDREISLLFRMVDQRYKKWAKTFYSVAKTFSEIDRKVAASLDASAGYDGLLRYYEEEVSRVPGWRVLPTESKRFVIKTSSDNKKFVDAAIDRLENSRNLFERDFPPSRPIEHVSVVRVCGTQEEFNQYGQTSSGVAGWFNPSSKELVLYDASERDRKISYAVMAHEAFHQYCHFLFEESEAHRWFDEGHGDYYGGFKFKGSKAEAGRMPGGLDRLGILREMLRDETWVPIDEHVNYDHSKWQSRGLLSYSQSWSIIYMLREGMRGNLSRKVWKKEYGNIIPNYVATLYAGFQSVYTAQRAEAEAEAKKQGQEFDPESLELQVSRAEKNKIWKAAIASSWGLIDIDEFEKDWLVYAEKHISN